MGIIWVYITKIVNIKTTTIIPIIKQIKTEAERREGESGEMLKYRGFSSSSQNGQTTPFFVFVSAYSHF
jgi:hypothetical protein